MRTALILACVLLAVGAASALGAAGTSGLGAPCARTPVAGDESFSLRSGRLQRTALLHIPPGITTGRRLPLVLALHGYRGNGGQMERYSGFSQLADADGFLVAYPSSAGRFWNSDGVRTLPDDVDFLRTLIGHLNRTQCLNPRRVFLAGVSNGGGMVALAACKLSALVDGIASVAGGYDGQPPCRAQQPVSVLEIHGTADPVVPYFGASGRPTTDGLPPFVNGWIGRDRCASVPQVRWIAPRARRFDWTSCADGVQVRHVRIVTGGHQWPGAHPPDPGPPATICASCEIWRFFSRLPARGGVRAARR